MTRVRALAVGAEVYPLVKTGGLADVMGALPAALAAEDIETRTLAPGYPAVLAALGAAEEVLRVPQLYGGAARILGGSAAGLDLFVLDAPHLFFRPGNPYVAAGGGDWPDNAFRFAALSRVAAEIGQGAIPAFIPQVVHTHDWHAGLIARGRNANYANLSRDRVLRLIDMTRAQRISQLNLSSI